MTKKNDITTEIDVQIDAMTTGTGFNNNYDNINEYKPGSKTYPNVKTEYDLDEYLDPDDQQVDTYSSQLTAIFTVVVDNTVTPTRLAVSQVLEDFQRLLEEGHPALQTKGWILADLVQSERVFSNITKRPATITMEWEIQYRVKRSNPSET